MSYLMCIVNILIPAELQRIVEQVKNENEEKYIKKRTWNKGPSRVSENIHRYKRSIK